jgi:hypothetical protein
MANALPRTPAIVVRPARGITRTPNVSPEGPGNAGINQQSEFSNQHFP